jgi:hypothetical protein
MQTQQERIEENTAIFRKNTCYVNILLYKNASHFSEEILI